MKYIFLVLILFLSRISWAQDTLRASLLFTGDIMQHDSQIAAAFDPSIGKYDFKHVFQYIKPTLSAPDLTIGNLELTLGGPPFKGYPQFSAPDELLEALKEAGFDVLVTANNHCVDRGRRGLERTIEKLDSAGFLHTGTFKDTVEWLNNNPLLLTVKGIRLSLLNYTYGTNGLPVYAPNMVNRIDTEVIRRDLRKAKTQQTDIIIVFVHWGQEYQSMPNDFQRSLAELCLKEGARMVIGAHPHVLQPMEWRKERDQLVVYSLGNFVSGQRDRYKNGGAMVNIALEKIVRRDSVTTSIKDVSYSLEYVYRAQNSRRTFHILPLDLYENDTIVVKGVSARQSMMLFGDDARLLYGKENKNVPEKMNDGLK